MTIFKNCNAVLFKVLLITAVQAQVAIVGEGHASAVPSSANAVNPLEEGSKIPTVMLTSPEGDSFDLNNFVKEQPVVLIFYRGGWCPYCNVHLGELMDADPKLRGLGYQILAVSPDNPEKLKESMEKHQMDYKLLSDSSLIAAKVFGVAFGEAPRVLPVPSVFIIDKEGIVRFTYYNPDYKTRINVDKLIKEAKEAL